MSLNAAASQQGTTSLDAAAHSLQGAKSQGYLSQQQQATKSLSSATTQLQGTKSVVPATPSLQGTKSLSPGNPFLQGSRRSGFGTKNNGVPPQQQGTKPLGSANPQLEDGKSFDLATSQLQGARSIGYSTPQLQGTRSLTPSNPFPQGTKRYGYGAKPSQGSKNPNPIISPSQGQGPLSQEPDGTKSIGSVGMPEQDGKRFFSASSVQMHKSKSYDFVASSAKSASSVSSYSVKKGYRGPVAAPIQKGYPAASVISDDRSPDYDDRTHALDGRSLGHSMLQAQDRKSLAPAAVTPEQAGKTATLFNPPLDAVPMVPEVAEAKSLGPAAGLPEVAGKSIWSDATPAQVGKSLGSQPLEGKSVGPHVPGQQEGKSQRAVASNTRGFLPTYQGNQFLVPQCAFLQESCHICGLYPCAQEVCVMGYITLFVYISMLNEISLMFVSFPICYVRK